MFCILLVASSTITPIFGQITKGTESITASFRSTHDSHLGGLISYENFWNEHMFYNYSVGASESHNYKWEYLVDFDMGYRFKLNNYQPDIRFGFGYLFGKYKEDILDTKNGSSNTDELQASITTTLKLGLFNWNFPDMQNFPFRVFTNIGVQYQFPTNRFYDRRNEASWHLLMETGLGYYLK